ITRVQYSEESSKTFEYGEDGQIILLLQSNGRTTKRNPDSTWTSYTRQGRQMKTSPQASLTVDQDGTATWTYQSDDSRLMERVDGSSAFVDGTGNLRTVVTPSQRTFRISDDGDLEYDAEEEDTLLDIAVDALKAWRWQIPFHEPSAGELEALVAAIRAAN